ncbi:MAG: bifunctional glutamate N-acetyltransferase/amino-acid acetyltransferase ArgJ [Paracoccaceae bacterium]
MAKIEKVSPLAPAKFPNIPEINGVEFSTAAAGIKYQDRPDAMLAILDPGTEIAGVFTLSSTRSYAVIDCEKKIRLNDNSMGAAIIVNSGNANAFTGSRGEVSVDAITAAVSDRLQIPQSRVFSSSTGVIGEEMPHSLLIGVLDQMIIDKDGKNFIGAAKAIMTTDTYPKGSVAKVQSDEGEILIAGIAKGSGMIAPDMATMLVYIFTDALIKKNVLQSYLSEINERTFNSISVDGDTSTSDTVLMAATGKSGISVEKNHKGFLDALTCLMTDLAHQVVKDGEGASKFVEINILNAKTSSDAKTLAKSIANSPLVKTAIAGEDPNWGRIVMAIGKSGAEAERDKLKIYFGDILVAENGWVSSSYSEAAGASYMKNSEIKISVDIGLGKANTTFWTCDFTNDYVSINADYRS